MSNSSCKLKKSYKSKKDNKNLEKSSKEMDSLELTIDSVARNFGTDLPTGTDSSSDNDIQMDNKFSPSATGRASAVGNQISPNSNSPSNAQTQPNLNSTKSPSIIMLPSPKTVNAIFYFLNFFVECSFDLNIKK
jgi:hypothetical protein